MEFTMEWNIICRICLQEGEMRSIFEKDDGNMKICDKIMQCSSVKIGRSGNLPENICTKCYENLKVAYTFRKTCESSDTVLQSFTKGNIVNDFIISDNGEIHKYVRFKGLTIKRLATLQKNKSENEIITADFEVDEATNIKVEHDENDYQLEDTENDDDDEMQEKNALEEKEIIEYHIEMNDNNTNEEDDDCDEFTLSLNTKYDTHDTENDGLTSIKSTPKRRQYTKRNGSTKKRKNSSQKEKEPKMHVCDICGNIYKQKHSLDTHMRRHRNEKPFSCEICGRAFVLNVELKCHMRTHTGQKPYGCRYCERHFSDFGSRIKHERMHTGERPYACGTCGKAFAYSYGLSSHMLTHTGEKPFECPKCGRRFTKKHHVKNHLQTHVKQELKKQMKGAPAATETVATTTATTENDLSIIVNIEDLKRPPEENEGDNYIEEEEIKEDFANIYYLTADEDEK